MPRSPRPCDFTHPREAAAGDSCSTIMAAIGDAAAEAKRPSGAHRSRRTVLGGPVARLGLSPLFFFGLTVLGFMSATNWFQIFNNKATLLGSSRSVRRPSPEKQLAAGGDGLEEEEEEHQRLLLCRVPNFTIRANRTFSIQYQCAGTAYDNFTQQLASYVQETRNAHNSNRSRSRSSASSYSSSSLWGRREFPLPNGTSVLALGNSHTRQTFQALLCQYSSAIVSYRPFLTGWASSYRIAFENGASLVLCTNSPLVYSSNWSNSITRYDPEQVPLEEYDAIVLGKFNKCVGRRKEEIGPSRNAATTGTTPAAIISRFDQTMLDDERQHPDEVQFTTVPPPSLRDVYERFNSNNASLRATTMTKKKPIVAVSMFAEYGRGWEESCRATVEQLHNEQVQQQQQHSHQNKQQKRRLPPPPLPIRVLSGRAHVEAMRMECGTDGPHVLSECWNDENDGGNNKKSPYLRSPRDMHRCNGGGGGGHADLLAWDVVEALYELLPPRRG